MSCRLGAQGGMEVVTIGNVTYIRGDVYGFAGASDVSGPLQGHPKVYGGAHASR